MILLADGKARYEFSEMEVERQQRNAQVAAVNAMAPKAGEDLRYAARMQMPAHGYRMYIVCKIV